MGQANRKNAQKADKPVQTEDVATGNAENLAQKKPRPTELCGWLKGFPPPVKIISESTQTRNPPRQSLDDQIYEARERAWPTLVRFKVPGVNRERVGFFISNDGFFVTELTPQFSHVEEATDAFGRRLEVEHVKDMSCHVNVSVLKVKTVTRTPFLRPLPDTGYAMAPGEEEEEEKGGGGGRGGWEYKSQLRLQSPVQMTSQPSYAYSADFERAGRPTQLYIADEGERGEPVLCLRSGYFVGLLLYWQRRRQAGFVLMTAHSFLWPEIEQAMQRHRENAAAK